MSKNIVWKYLINIKMDAMILINYVDKMNVHIDMVILYIVYVVIVSSYESNLHFVNRRKTAGQKKCCCYNASTFLFSWWKHFSSTNHEIRCDILQKRKTTSNR